MNKGSYIYIWLFVLLLCLSTQGQAQTLEQFFEDGISHQIQLGKEQRTLLLNNYISGKSDTLLLPNGGIAKVIEYKGNNLLKIKTSSQGFFSLKRWNNQGKPIFGLSWWVCGPHCDGQTSFVSPLQIKNSYEFPEITIKDFFNQDALKEDGITAEELCQKFELSFIHFEFNATDTIWAFNNTPEYLEELRQKKMEKYWKGNALPIVFKNYNTFTVGTACIRKPKE